MDKKKLDKITDAIDSSIEEFQSDPDIIFQSENDRLKLKFSQVDKFKKWRNSKKCIYENCDKKSIAKSHTIQKSNSIKLISENSHVLTPKFNKNSGELEIALQGINEASTFPGFCNDHEKLFEEFENKKTISDESHLILQIYRTICREIVVAEHHEETLVSSKGSYISYRNKKLQEILLSKLGKDFMQENGITANSYELQGGDPKILNVNKAIVGVKKYLTSLYNLKNAILNDLGKNKFQKIAYVAKALDFVLPVSIAGIGNFRIKKKTKTKEVEVIFNVLPEKDKTLIVVCSLKKNITLINDYMNFYQHPLQAISLVESWMVHGSDHWFIKPSTWNILHPVVQNKILDDIHDLSKNIGYDYPLSIFYDLRTYLVTSMDKIYNKLEEPLKELLERERSKLTIPHP